MDSLYAVNAIRKRLKKSVKGTEGPSWKERLESREIDVCNPL